MAKGGPIRLGILGLGRAGFGMHCRELEGNEKRFTILAGCDTFAPWRDRMAEAYPACKLYERFEDMLADDEVELVSVATRSVDHCEHALKALKAGKHVFLEKPMTVDYAEAKRLQQAAKKAKGKLFIRHNRRCEPGFLHVREVIASGVLGDIHTIKLVRGGYSRRDDWQTLKKYGGGQLLNWGPHIVDHGLQFLGAPQRPLRGLWADLKRIAAVGDAEDHLKIVMTGATGCVVDIEISGGAAVTQPEYVVLGSKGGLTCDEKTISLRYLDPKKRLKPKRPDEGVPSGWGASTDLKWIEKTIPVKPRKTFDIWDELYGAIRLGRRFPISMEEAVEVMRVISAVKEGTDF